MMVQPVNARCALVLIDMQRDFCAPGGYADRAGLDIERLRRPIPAQQALLACARRQDMLVIHTREGHRPDLTDLPAWKRQRAMRSGAPIGEPGPMGRLLVRGEHGHDLIDECRPLPGEPVIDKPGYSAFVATDLELILRSRDITTLLIAGVTTEVCVSSTLRTAIDLGFHCITVADACGSAHSHLHDAALAMISVEGGVFGELTNADQLITRLETRP